MAEEGTVVTEIQTENSLVNKPWQFQPGQSGNPNGRPKKGTAITDVLREMLEANPDIKRKLSNKLLELALEGDLAAINILLDRLEGKPNITATLNHRGPPRPILDDGIPQDDSN